MTDRDWYNEDKVIPLLKKFIDDPELNEKDNRKDALEAHWKKLDNSLMKKNRTWVSRNRFVSELPAV